MIRDEWFFRIKTATRALVKMVGTHEDAGLIAGVSKSQMHRWASPTDAEIITLTAAMKLEAECGMPCISEVMASRLGNHLAKADGSPAPGCMVTAFAASPTSSAMWPAASPKLCTTAISPNEHTAICGCSDASSASPSPQAQGAGARLRAVVDTRRAA
jgi:hypothetical protein